MQGSRDGRVLVHGVSISHPGRVVDAASGATKLDVARYYEAVAEVMLPHVAGRPLTVVHCPVGLAAGCRYMKHSKVWAPPAVRRVEIQEKTKRGEYLVIDDAEALLSVVQMDVLEVHTWNSRVARLEQPDRMLIDLDPGPAVPWRDVVDAALEIRGALAALGHASWVKTTGGVGLHVDVPLAPRHHWTQCLAFARGFAETLERHAPTRYTTAYARHGRDRKILIDYLRNNRTNTSVAAFSTRARRGLPVSVPVAWEELEPRHPPRWNLRTVPDRLRTLRVDPWAGYAPRRQRLSRALLQAVGTVATVPGGGATMRMLLAILVAFGAAQHPGAARAEDRAGGDGRIQTDEATIEIVRPHRGRVIETPEGYLRVEEGPDLDDSNDLGSFGTYHAAALDAESAPDGTSRRAPWDPEEPVPVRPDGMVDTTAPIPGPDPCRAQREKYMRRLLEMSGVKVDRPLELLDGLSGPGGGGGGNVLGTGYISPGVDPLKPLAWDQELRSLGRDLASCQARVATARP